MDDISQNAPQVVTSCKKGWADSTASASGTVQTAFHEHPGLPGAERASRSFWKKVRGSFRCQELLGMIPKMATGCSAVELVRVRLLKEPGSGLRALLEADLPVLIISAQAQHRVEMGPAPTGRALASRFILESPQAVSAGVRATSSTRCSPVCSRRRRGTGSRVRGKGMSAVPISGLPARRAPRV